MRKSHFIALLAVSLLPTVALAETEIHKCTDADGGVMYTQLPCKDEVPAKTEEPVDTEAAEAPAQPVEITEILLPDTSQEDSASSEERAACQKRYRDEIDAIDAEIRREYSKEHDDDYKQRLLALTRKLRAC